MRSLFFVAFCTALAMGQKAPAASQITDASQITEEWLVSCGNETGYTEHVRHFKRLFSAMKVRGFLEFGVGFSTKYFIDNCDRVISAEVITPGSGPGWLKYCINLYRDCPNWTPIAYLSGKGLDTSWAPNKYMGIESVYRAASYHPVYLRSYSSIDPSYLDDLDKFVREQVAANTIDVGFVDAGVCLRGDMVQTLFNKVPIVVAHDVAPKEVRHLIDIYGYGRVVVPDNYVEIRVPFGMGTAFWVKNEPEYFGVIQSLQEYCKGSN